MSNPSPALARSRPAVVWFRDDLRLADNPALAAAAQSGYPVICLYVYDEHSPGLRPLGGASKWWLAHSLDALRASLEALGGRLDLFAGAADDILATLAGALRPAGVYWNRRYAAVERAIDDAIEAKLRAAAIAVETFNGTLGHEPWEVTPKAGGYFRVYGPYWRAAQNLGPLARPEPAPSKLTFAEPPREASPRTSVASLGLLPRMPDWAGGLREAWRPGEASGRDALRGFVGSALGRYRVDRDVPALAGSSRLSPHLRFGEVSPRQVEAAVTAAGAAAVEGGAKFRGEIAWRDFAYSLLFNLPDLATRAFDPNFGDFPYETRTPALLRAWRRGNTGYPIVDAGMRQLWRTGTMHNRIRMVTASFLVKHLLVDWRIGEAWFWDTLCDADPANNAVNWQWIAGCGPDAAPFFRVFNPTLQGEKFDPEGTYVRRFVPELARVAARWVHKPWEASARELAAAGVELGVSYPRAIVDHAEARARALAAFRRSRPARGRDSGAGKLALHP